MSIDASLITDQIQAWLPLFLPVLAIVMALTIIGGLIVFLPRMVKGMFGGK